jgi:hypothetical protein
MKPHATFFSLFKSMLSLPVLAIIVVIAYSTAKSTGKQISRTRFKSKFICSSCTFDVLSLATLCEGRNYEASLRSYSTASSFSFFLSLSLSVSLSQVLIFSSALLSSVALVGYFPRVRDEVHFHVQQVKLLTIS